MAPRRSAASTPRARSRAASTDATASWETRCSTDLCSAGVRGTQPPPRPRRVEARLLRAISLGLVSSSAMSISGTVNGFLDLPVRPSKPREVGITHVMDKGMTQTQIEGLMETGGDYVDIVKLGWGTSYVTQNLKQKLALYRSLDIPVICGGTLLEIAEVRGKLDGYRSWLSENGFESVEVSDGTIDLPRERKLEIIETLAKDFRVLSEVGSKDAGAHVGPTT